MQSLSGDAERDVAVEAVGQGECSLYSEDTVTDEEGRFRLRGLLVSGRSHTFTVSLSYFTVHFTECPVFLQPGCKYLIQLRAEGNDHIERALPQHRAIEVRSRRIKGFSWSTQWVCNMNVYHSHNQDLTTVEGYHCGNYFIFY